MQELEKNGRKFKVDEDGYLLNFGDFCDEWVQQASRAEGVEKLTDEHILIITTLRKFYSDNGTAPPIRTLTIVCNLTLVKIYDLFPSGPAKGACKVAGLPRPAGCV